MSGSDSNDENNLRAVATVTMSSDGWQHGSGRAWRIISVQSSCENFDLQRVYHSIIETKQITVLRFCIAFMLALHYPLQYKRRRMRHWNQSVQGYLMPLLLLRIIVHHRRIQSSISNLKWLELGRGLTDLGVCLIRRKCRCIWCRCDGDEEGKGIVHGCRLML